jgi:ornithine carbamoyltransferase
MEEHIAKPLHQCKVVFCGDIRNNMAYAWMYGCAKLGMHFVAYGPPELRVDEQVLARARAVAEATGALIEVCHEPSCLKGADVLYSDIWASMGEEAQIPERVRLLTPYRITMETVLATKNPHLIFLHCLPSFHDFETTMAAGQKEQGYDIREVTDEVFNSRYSKVFDEAENRMHTIKAVLVATMA